jgi:catechol 2,3-dioxygenase-like lactoylglutathione lyase family enzyme
MKLDHIAINVTDIQRSIDWYQTEFNAIIEYSDETWAILKIGTVKLALTLASQHKPHIAFTQDKPPLDYTKIKTHRDGSTYIYVDDPDGNVIEKIWWHH